MITEEKLLEVLPHGSGIDCKWEIEENSKSFLAKNSYHLMDENGFYCGYIDFSLRIPKDNPYDFKLMFHTNSTGRRKVRDNMLRQYLDDTITYSFLDYKIKENK